MGGHFASSTSESFAGVFQAASGGLEQSKGYRNNKPRNANILKNRTTLLYNQVSVLDGWRLLQGSGDLLLEFWRTNAGFTSR